MANWELIKEQYCSGIPPRELAKKHKLKAQTISDKAYDENWKLEKTKKTEEIAKTFKEETERITTKALQRLEQLLDSKDIKDTDLTSAIGKALDISGLKSQKVEQTNIDTSPFEIKIVEQNASKMIDFYGGYTSKNEQKGHKKTGQNQPTARQKAYLLKK